MAGVFSGGTTSTNPRIKDSTSPTANYVELAPLQNGDLTFSFGVNPTFVSNRDRTTTYKAPGKAESRTIALELAHVEDMDADALAIALGNVPTGWAEPLYFSWTQTVGSATKLIEFPIALGQSDSKSAMVDTLTATITYQSDAVDPITVT